jgi:hypothetical protein
LFGGEDEVNLYQDFYVYETLIDKWKEIDYLGMPPARKNACIIWDFPLIYILGGITTNGYVSEVWKIDLLNASVTILQSKFADGPESFAFSSCYGEEEADGDYVIYVAKGESFARAPIGEIYALHLEDMHWEEVGSGIEVSRTAATKTGDRFVYVGGEAWGIFSYRFVYEYNFSTGIERRLTDIPMKLYNGASCYFKSSIYIHGGSNTYGNKYRENIMEGALYNLDLNDNCEDCRYLCSPGSYFVGSVCQACPPGTYQDQFGAASCIRCPPGTYSSHQGNDSIRQCSPCPKNSYASEAGSVRCFVCSAGYDCAVGSTGPAQVSPIHTGIVSVQPILYSKNLAGANQSILIIELMCGALGLAVIMVFLCTNSGRPIFKKLDLYNDKHNHFLDQVMYIRKNPFGGLSSVLFLLTTLTFMIVSFINFGLDNIVEQKALVLWSLFKRTTVQLEASSMSLSPSARMEGSALQWPTPVAARSLLLWSAFNWTLRKPCVTSTTATAL